MRHITKRTYYTDYPIVELGDAPYYEAPVRSIRLVAYDRNKYVMVDAGSVRVSIKRCYIYPTKGRCGDVECISHHIACELPDSAAISELLTAPAGTA